MDMDMDLRTTHEDPGDRTGDAFEIGREARVERLHPRDARLTAFGSSWYHDEAIAQAVRETVEARSHPYR